MSSFGTSVINKSGKKLAPKAPARRKPPVSTPSAAANAANSRLGTAEPETSEPPNKRQRLDASVDNLEERIELSNRAPLPTPPSTEDATSSETSATSVNGSAEAFSTNRSGGLIVAEPSLQESRRTVPATAIDSAAHSASTITQTRDEALEPAARASSKRNAQRKTATRTTDETTDTEAPPNEPIPNEDVGLLQTSGATDGDVLPEPLVLSSPQQTTRGRKGKEKELQATASTNAATAKGTEVDSSSRTRSSRARPHVDEREISASHMTTRATRPKRNQDTAPGLAPAKRGRGRKKVVSDETIREEDGEDDAVVASTSADADDAVAQEASGQKTRSTRKPRKSRAKKASTQERSGSEPTPPIEHTNGEGHSGDADEGSSSPAVSKKRRRATTPEDAEAHEIDVSTTTMIALTRDSRKGKKSKLEAAMQDIDWADVKRRKEEAEQRAYELGELERSEQEVNARLDKAGEQEAPSNAPRTKIVNGQIVIDTSSLVVDRHAVAAADAANQPIEELEEDDITAHVTSHSWVHDSRRDPEERRVMKMKSDPWNEAQTNEFYKALSMFGTDFFIISKMFPGKTRRQIKLKFVREERANPVRINSALLGDESLPMDINTYATATGREESYYKDPDVLKQELRDEEQRQKEEIEKQREEQEQAQREKQRKAAGKTAAAQKERAAKRAGNGKKKNRNVPGPAAAGVEVGVEPAPET